MRLRLVGKNAEVFRCNSQKCTIPGKRYSPAGAVFLSLALSTIFLHYKRIVEFQTPMLIQIHILSNSVNHYTNIGITTFENKFRFTLNFKSRIDTSN